MDNSRQLKKKSRFPWWHIDRYLPADLFDYDHREVHYKARVLVVVPLISGVNYIVLSLGIFLLTEQLGLLYYVTWLSLLALVLFFSIPVVFFITSSFVFAANLFGFAATLAIYCVIAVTGGPQTTPIASHLPLIAVFIFMMTGLKIAVFWGVVELVLWLTAMAAQNFWAPSYVAPDVIYQAKLVSVASAGIALLCVLWFFSIYQNHLLGRLQVERDRALFSAAHDPLTGIANRQTFEHRLEYLIERHRMTDSIDAVLIIDLNGFKPINDTIGHQAGDAVLVAVAARIQQTVRRSDLAARIGGDEFAVLLCDVRNRDDLAPILEKLHSTITAPVRLDNGRQISVGASIGVALVGADGNDLATVLHSADQAMYRAKSSRMPSAFFSDMVTGSD